MLRSSSLPSTRKKNVFNRSRNELGSSKRLAGDQTSSIRLQVHELSPFCKSRKKADAVDVAATAFLKPREDVGDDGEFGKNFGEEGWSNDADKCMWLSSGTSSPSSCFTDRRFSVILDPSLDEWLVSFGPSLGSHIKRSGSCSFDLEGNGLWVSSEDLQGIGSEIIEFLGSGGLLIHENSQIFSPSEYVPEDLDLTDTGCDEPLFWPFDKKSDWSPESKWDMFIMSPRKVARRHETVTSADLIHLRINTKLY